MKKGLLLLMLVVSALSVMAENAIVVWQRNGAKTEFSFKQNPKTSYNGNNFVISTDDQEVSFNVLTLQKVTFILDSDSGIKDVKVDAKFRFHDNVIDVSGAAPGSLLRIFSIKGNLCGKFIVDNDGRISVDLGSYTSGVYIINLGKASYKVIKR